MNATFEKFGWPATKIAELDHWAVMLRPEQPTLGSLVLACKQPVRSFGDVDAAGHVDLGKAIGAIETMLRGAVGYDRINYLMLMMVDPDVHFHVIPRYDGTRSHGGLKIPDAGWPGPPALGQATTLTEADSARMIDHLNQFWPL